MKFFTGLHQPSDAQHFDAAFISVNRLRTRKGALPAGGPWIMDSGAFSELARHGRYTSTPQEYAAEVRRWASNGSAPLLAAVTQDWMVEPAMLQKTGLTVADHQRLTIERFDQIKTAIDGACYLMPVLQGWTVDDYLRHITLYGDARLPYGAWVGVGSVCKRQGDPVAIARILRAIKAAHPDLRLHGFGVKTTSLQHPEIRDLLYSADSMAWSFAARWEGRNRNCWREAKAWTERMLAPTNGIPLSNKV